MPTTLITPDALEGDGINLPFFQLLWSKANEASEGTSSSGRGLSSTSSSNAVPLRLPDTIVFQFGQPLYWYFTSKRGGKDGKSVTILKKRKQNVTVEKIEELFLKKASTRGVLGEHDVVAYFIASADCTSRFRRKKGHSNDGRNSHDGNNKVNGGGYNDNGMDKTSDSAACDDAPQCDIEYFDGQGLRNFLEHGRKNQTGILQRFVQPAGGGTHNSLIQAIWTPNLCLMERRRTRQSLHDTRFGLFERTVTFEGPEIHSSSKPIRGTVLGGKIKQLCNDMVHHVSSVIGSGRKRSRSGSRSSANMGRPASDDLARMVVYFKVDINDDIWILFSSSLRLDGKNLNHHQPQQLADFTNIGDATSSTGIITASRTTPTVTPLNIDKVVKFGPTIKLNPNANHDPNKILENDIILTYCPSCGLDVSKEHFYPVPYKTIISHFEHALDMFKGELGLDRLIEWPPDAQLIRAAGGVGFGFYLRKRCKGTTDADADAGAASSTNSAEKTIDEIGICSNGKAVSELPEEDLLIPPVIRQVHGRLKAQGYQRYRNDPLFLHKNCNVCEDCFLAYAQLASTSFQMIHPVRLDQNERKERIEQRRHRKEQAVEWKDAEESTVGGGRYFDFSSKRDQDYSDTNDGSTKIKSIGALLSDAPSLPPVILEPPPEESSSHMEGSVNEQESSSYKAATSISATTSSISAPPLPPIDIDDFLSNHNHMTPTDRSQHYHRHHPLQHLISSYELIERANTERMPSHEFSSNCRKKQAAINPYAVEQRIVEPKGRYKKGEQKSGQKHGDVREKDRIQGEKVTATASTPPISSNEGLGRAWRDTEDKRLLTSALTEIYKQERQSLNNS